MTLSSKSNGPTLDNDGRTQEEADNCKQDNDNNNIIYDNKGSPPLKKVQFF